MLSFEMEKDYLPSQMELIYRLQLVRIKDNMDDRVAFSF